MKPSDEEIERVTYWLRHGQRADWSLSPHKAADMLLALKARAEAAEKDAARYREALERIAKESRDYQYVARAALETKP